MSSFPLPGHSSRGSTDDINTSLASRLYHDIGKQQQQVNLCDKTSSHPPAIPHIIPNNIPNLHYPGREERMHSGTVVEFDLIVSRALQLDSQGYDIDKKERKKTDNQNALKSFCCFITNNV